MKTIELKREKTFGGDDAITIKYKGHGVGFVISDNPSLTELRKEFKQGKKWLLDEWLNIN